MVVAGEKYVDDFDAGKIEIFHTIELNGKKGRLYEEASITTLDGETIKGMIVFISQDQVDIMTDSDAKTIALDQITDISS